MSELIIIPFFSKQRQFYIDLYKSKKDRYKPKECDKKDMVYAATYKNGKTYYFKKDILFHNILNSDNEYDSDSSKSLVQSVRYIKNENFVFTKKTKGFCKRVLLVTYENGEQKKYKSCQDFAKNMSFSPSVVSEYLNGKKNNSFSKKLIEKKIKNVRLIYE